MKIFILLLLAAIPAHAKPSSLRDRPARIRQNFELLGHLCQQMNGFEKGECYAAHEIAAKNCEKILDAFRKESEQAAALVKEAAAWRQRKSMVTETKDTISISFDISLDPTYPFHRQEKVENDALDASNEAIGEVIDKVKELKKSRVCRPARAALEKLWQQWYGDGGEAVVDFHNAIPGDIGSHLMDARRALEAGALDEAMGAFQQLLPGAEIKRVR